MAKEKHIHRLKKHKYKNGTTIFFCTLNCNFKIEAPLAVGHTVLCNQCGSPFTMDETTIKLVRPHCDNCGRMKIKDSNGKLHYIKKNIINNDTINTTNTNESGNISSLKERLATVVTMTDEMIDEEI